MIDHLSKYIPSQSVHLVREILIRYPIAVKIVRSRSSKHGDFKVRTNGKLQITINENLNDYHFLITLIHELAHLVTFKHKKHSRPHGIEWKQNFQHLMLPFLHPGIFPMDLLPLLAKYLKNPKASTGADVNLTLALKQFDVKSGKNFIFELQQGSLFQFKNKIYKIGDKRRTRYECVEINSKKKYLFNQNAEIELIK